VRWRLTLRQANESIGPCVRDCTRSPPRSQPTGSLPGHGSVCVGSHRWFSSSRRSPRRACATGSSVSLWPGQAGQAYVGALMRTLDSSMTTVAYPVSQQFLPEDHNRTGLWKSDTTGSFAGGFLGTRQRSGAAPASCPSGWGGGGATRGRRSISPSVATHPGALARDLARSVGRGSGLGRLGGKAESCPWNERSRRPKIQQWKVR
jgi:hypothetical protein